MSGIMTLCRDFFLLCLGAGHKFNQKRITVVDKKTNEEEKDPKELLNLIKGNMDSTNPFKGRVKGDRLVFLSDDTCRASDVKQVVELLHKEGRCIHINTGTHGDPSGNTQTTLDQKNKKLCCASNFIKEDMELANNVPKCSLHIVTTYSGAIYPEHRDVVDAWCFSEQKYEKRLEMCKFSSFRVLGQS